ncbi:MAG: tyrosine-type recombinase/integrase [Anaerolineae bacterium]
MDWGSRIINNDGLIEQFEECLSSSALAPATIVNYVADLRAFLRWSEETRDAACSPLCLDTSDIEDFCTYLRDEKGNAPSTVNRRLQALRKFYGLAVAQGWTQGNPAEQASLLDERVSERSRSLTQDDVSRLLRAVEQSRSRQAARDLAVIQLLLGAGLKLGELTELRLEDVHLDGEQPTLDVRDVSGSLSRKVDLENDVHDALRSYLSVREAADGVDYFCVNRDGNALSTRSVQRLLRHYARAAELDGLTTQSLRYVYATRVYESSGDLRMVADNLGHRHLATTIRYLRPGSDE